MKYALYIKWNDKKPSKAYLINLKNVNDTKLYKLWDNNKTLYEIFAKQDKLLLDLKSIDHLVIVNYERFIRYFGPISNIYVYDVYYENDEKSMYWLIKDYNNNLLFMDWQKIRAQASEIYYKLGQKGIVYGYKKIDINYGLNVFSGRSKTTGFNIQGKNDKFDLKHVDESKSVYLSFDWISADARICAILSQDDNLLESFLKSDPYTYIADALDNKIERSLCKFEWNKAVNSLDYNNPLFNLFPKFRKWLKSKIYNLSIDNYTESLMGRRFYSDGSHKQNKRAINSIFQGSVAHCIQNALIYIDELTEGILTEQHDSMIVCCNECEMLNKLKDISKIMIKPLEPYYDYKFPLRVGIGNSWGKYKYFKEYR